MKTFITSDLHFSHRNIIKYQPNSRGYLNSIEEMNEELVKKFNDRVTEDDHTFILGDIGFGSPAETMEFLKMMNGRKTIIHGNHDVPHPGSKHPRDSLIGSDVFNNPEQRRLAGIVEDTPYKVISQTVDGARYGIVLFHFRIASWDGCHHGSIHLHGHEHGNGPVLDARCMDIGCDTNELYPYNIEDVVRQLVKKSKMFVGHHDGKR